MSKLINPQRPVFETLKYIDEHDSTNCTAIYPSHPLFVITIANESSNPPLLAMP